jgi:hypothetical protein
VCKRRERERERRETDRSKVHSLEIICRVGITTLQAVYCVYPCLCKPANSRHKFTLAEGFLALTAGFPCFFPSCKANARVKKIQFLPYGTSIRSWICLTHKTYTCHTVQNTYSASMAVSDSQSILRFNLRCLSYSALFRFLSRMRCTSMGVWGSMTY